MAGFYLTGLFLLAVRYFAPILLKPNIYVSPFFFLLVVVFWWWLVERRRTITWVRGGLVGAFSSIIYYFLVGLMFGAVTFGAGAGLMWVTGIFVVPCVVLAGVSAAALRKRVGNSRPRDK